MQDETVAVDSIESEERYQVFVNDITWSKDTIGKFRAKYNVYEQLPRQMTFVLPDSIIAKEDSKDFYDIVETFIYNIDRKVQFFGLFLTIIVNEKRKNPDI